MRSARRIRLLPVAAMVVGATLLAGCYTFRPMDRPPRPGDHVRANLTTPGAIRLSELTGEPERSLEGEVAVVDDDALGIAVVRTRSTKDFQPQFVLKDTLLLPREDVASVELRELSPLRTGAALAAGGGAVGYLLYRALGGGRGGGEEPPEGGRPTFVLIPLLSIPVGR